MKRADWWRTAVSVGLVIVAGIWSLRHKPAGSSIALGKQPAPQSKTAPLDSAVESEDRDAASRKRILADWENLIRWLDSKPQPADEEIQARLLAMRVAWTEMDPQLLAETISQLLASGDDRVTGLAFKIGPHGFLKGWPTLRVFLLDVLAASDPELAMRVAKGVLDETKSADEFAVGLRSLTRQGMGRASDGELSERFGQMLGHDEWRKSAGFAEAMDLARLIGTPEVARQLVAWNGNPALQSMALDEFAAEHPEQILEILAEDQSLGAVARASLMARANPDDPRQLADVDAYLHDPARSPDEAAAFLRAFPLRSATTGFRLYGKTPAPYNYEQIAAGDRAALERVNQWLNDPALGNYRADLVLLQQRLTKWTEQAR